MSKAIRWTPQAEQFVISVSRRATQKSPILRPSWDIAREGFPQLTSSGQDIRRPHHLESSEQSKNESFPVHPCQSYLSRLGLRDNGLITEVTELRSWCGRAAVCQHYRLPCAGLVRNLTAEFQRTGRGRARTGHSQTEDHATPVVAALDSFAFRYHSANSKRVQVPVLSNIVLR